MEHMQMDRCLQKEVKMTPRVISFIFFILTFITLVIFLSGEVSARQSITVIPWHTGNDNLDVIADECARKIEYTFGEIGVFNVISSSQARQVRNSLVRQSKGEISVKNILQVSDSERTMIVLVSHDGINFYATVYLIRRSDESSQKITVRSGTQSILSNLVIREIIRMYGSTDIEVSVKKVYSGGDGVIDAGEYSHLESGDTIRVDGHGLMRIISAGRFESSVSCDFKISEGMRFDVSSRFNADRLTNLNEKEIHLGLVKTFGAEYTVQKGVPDPEKRFIEGTLIVSMGGSLILPAYGAFLSTYYMGFKNPEPAYGGLLLSASLEFGALLYTPVTTDMRSWRSYLPVNSKDKSNRDLRLQRYLWSTIPFTFAVTYCDQLSYQYQLRRVLPPLFDNPDRTASILSLFIPGGGFFYKGYRGAGWGIYCSELALGGYAAAEYGSKKSRNALIALGVMKLAEMFSSAVIPCSYEFYNKEIKQSMNPSFSFNIVPESDGTFVYQGGIEFPF